MLLMQPGHAIDEPLGIDQLPARLPVPALTRAFPRLLPQLGIDKSSARHDLVRRGLHGLVGLLGLAALRFPLDDWNARSTMARIRGSATR
jgi:hypothetical protein